jgi:septum formation protein
VKLLLASRSAARRRMLEAAGVSFEAVDAPFDEADVKQAFKRRGMGAAELALALAEAKARMVPS